MAQTVVTIVFCLIMAAGAVLAYWVDHGGNWSKKEEKELSKEEKMEETCELRTETEKNFRKKNKIK